MSRVIRFGLGSIESLGEVADELGLRRLLLVTSRRGSRLAERLPVIGVYDGVRSHVPRATVAEAADAAERADADGLVGLGGGSAIDTCKAVTIELLGRGRELRTIAVPTTYAGAEWSPSFGVRDEVARRKGGGADERSTPVAAIYDPELTLELPRAESGGTAMNALAHCVEATYAKGRTESGDRNAFCGARAIAHALPLVLANGADIYARTRLLEGAMRASWALADAGLALGHAMAQALGGRFGLPHGALNSICLPAAMRFNEPVIASSLELLGDAMGTGDPIAKVEELSRLTGFTRLRDLGIAAEELEEVAEAAADRPGAKANPREATPAEVEDLLRSVW